ncbi:MAG: hypothetical protein M1818_000104 [Claussenomyces sp. TS43310]|nr:MAG: hypothetical protein M1818_000104 [Claussenomyces sp. TS43310]
MYLSELIGADQRLRHQPQLRILDLCSGTGCISLSLYSSLWKLFSAVEVLGVDVSDTAVSLARRNVNHNVTLGHLPPEASRQISFVREDILCEDWVPERHARGSKAWDIVISNPPYISKEGFNKDTARSVRTFEPQLALVPPSFPLEPGYKPSEPSALDDSSMYDVKLPDKLILSPEDIFYPRILSTAMAARAKFVLMETADLTQALRVSKYAHDMRCWSAVEIYRDWPDETTESISQRWDNGMELKNVVVKGQGNGRSILCRRQNV